MVKDDNIFYKKNKHQKLLIKYLKTKSGLIE